MSLAIVIQCFAKPDTLAGLCASLTACAGCADFHLIFWHDVPSPSPKHAHYLTKSRQVQAVIADFSAREQGRFASITSCGNSQNLGTCATCRAALDAALAIHEFAIFTEDDTIFSRDALIWFRTLYEAGVLARPEVLALSGESIYFDARTQELPDGYAARAREVARARDLANYYLPFEFVPSTCFATTPEKWALFGEIRGQPRGDEDVCALCRSDHYVAIFPVVARVKDIGMLHQDGYSVHVLGADGVREIKNTYLMAQDLPQINGVPEEFTGNTGRLFEESVKLMGFDPILTAPAPATTLTAPAVIAALHPWKLWCFSLRNFGDALTPYILSRYGVQFELVEPFEQANLLGIGSNLDRVRANHSPITIWTSGFMYPKDRPVRYGPDVRLLAVRGQNTLAAVEPAAPAQLALGDGGLLTREIFPFDRGSKLYELGVIAHMSDVNAARALGIPHWSGVKMIDVFAPIDEVLAQIAACRRIASSSLHGIIVADAFGIANIYTVYAGGREVEGDGFKYDDHASSLGYSMKRIRLDQGSTRGQVIDAIDGVPARGGPSDGLIGDLEMTVAILRGVQRGLCG